MLIGGVNIFKMDIHLTEVRGIQSMWNVAC